jgi:cytoskeletal protein RodZ
MSEELSVGAKLKQIRQEKGKSLEEVSMHTKIQINILAAIEDDRIDDFSPVYIKGFLKLYAQFLGIDPQEIIQEYQAKLESKNEQVALKEAEAAFKQGVGLRRDFAFFIPRFKVGFKLFLIICVIFVAAKLISLSKTPRALSPVIEKQDSPALKQETALAKISPKPREDKKTAESVKLAIMAKATSWIQVYSDGKKIFEGILKKGMKESWCADKEIRLSLGNAGGVEIEVNDEIISPLGRRGQVLKNIIITPEDISVPGGLH